LPYEGALCPLPYLFAPEEQTHVPCREHSDQGP
jgi:hypothetical protein